MEHDLQRRRDCGLVATDHHLHHAGVPAGDLTGDGIVDMNDLNIIQAALNTPAYGPNDPRDLDHDGKITVLDARKLVLLCTKALCATP